MKISVASVLGCVFGMGLGDKPFDDIEGNFRDTFMTGKNHYDVIQMKIYSAFCAGVPARKIAKEYGVSRQRVHDIVRVMREKEFA